MSLREAFRVLEILFMRMYTQFSEKEILKLYVPLCIYSPTIHNKFHFVPTSRPFFSANKIA